MNLLYGRDEFVASWVKDKTPVVNTGFGDCTAIGVMDGGRLIAGVVYNEYRPHCRSICMSVAAEPKTRWMTRGHLYRWFFYPFVQLGCNRVTAVVASENFPSWNLVERLGFVREGVLRRAFGNDDALIYGMLKDECKWIQGVEHERLAKRTASA